MQQPAGADIGPVRGDRATRKGLRFIMTSKISMPTAMDCGKFAARQAAFFPKPKSTSLKGHVIKPKMVGECWSDGDVLFSLPPNIYFFFPNCFFLATLADNKYAYTVNNVKREGHSPPSVPAKPGKKAFSL